MLNRDVCYSCRISARLISEHDDPRIHDSWGCPVYSVIPSGIYGRIRFDHVPPKDCLHKLEQAMAAALTVNVDSDSTDPRTP